MIACAAWHACHSLSKHCCSQQEPVSEALRAVPAVIIAFLPMLYADGESFGHVGILDGVHLLSR